MGNGEVFLDASFNLHYPDGATHTDNFPPDLKPVLNDHWSKFPPQHPLIVDAVGIFMGLLWIVGTIGNLLVIYIFMCTPSLKTPTNMFVVNLAIADLCMFSTMGFPCFLQVFMAGSVWPWSATLCKIYGAIGATFGNVAINTLLVIGWDRWNIIVKGLSGTKVSLGMAWVINILNWAFCIMCSTFPFTIGWGGYALEGLFVTCGYDYLTFTTNIRTYMAFGIFFQYAGPLLIACFFYSQIVSAVFAHERALREQAKKMNVESLRQGDAANKNAEMKIAKVAFTNVMLWVVAWTPYAVNTFLGICSEGTRAMITPVGSQSGAFFAKLASVLNPIVFAMSHPKYREALGEKFPCLYVVKEVQGEAPKA